MQYMKSICFKRMKRGLYMATYEYDYELHMNAMGLYINLRGLLSQIVGLNESHGACLICPSKNQQPLCRNERPS